MPQVPYLTLNSNYKIPQIGLGTWQVPPKEAGLAVEAALEIGYRHIDCAFVYGNQAEIGCSFGKIFSSGKVNREDVFVTSKIWNTCHSFKTASECLDKILQDLQLPYLDMCLIHWPMGYKEGGELFPTTEDGKGLYSDVDYLETWEALENAVRVNKVRSIGLSNFSRSQVQRVLNNCVTKPTNLQIESHPYFNQNEIIKWCKENGIEVSCYSPLSNPDSIFRKAGDPNLFEESSLKKLSEKYKKTISQIVLRWSVQRGVAVIPKSVYRDHMIDNLNIWDFKLSDEDVEVINNIDRNWRMVPLDRDLNHPFYPFK